MGFFIIKIYYISSSDDRPLHKVLKGAKTFEHIPGISGTCSQAFPPLCPATSWIGGGKD
jgi:hypothetical protein